MDGVESWECITMHGVSAFQSGQSTRVHFDHESAQVRIEKFLYLGMLQLILPINYCVTMD